MCLLYQNKLTDTNAKLHVYTWITEDLSNLRTLIIDQVIFNELVYMSHFYFKKLL